MDQSVLSDLTDLVDALRAETTAASITPERLGGIIQQIIDILPDLDDSDIADNVASALTAAQAAAASAASAVAAAEAAQTQAASALNNVTSLSASIAEAISKATSAYTTAQSASTAAQQATTQVSGFNSRLVALETFKTNAEHIFSKTPEYHSATWLEDEAGVLDEEHPERRIPIRYTSMKDAIEGGNKLIKLFGFTAIGADVNASNHWIHLTFVLADANGATKLLYYTVKPYTNYCTVDKVELPMPYYDATWATSTGGTRDQLDEFINYIEASPRVLMMAGNQPIVWAARRTNDVVQFAVMLSDGMRVYTVEYSSGSSECSVSYDDTSFE